MQPLCQEFFAQKQTKTCSAATRANVNCRLTSPCTQKIRTPNGYADCRSHLVNILGSTKCTCSSSSVTVS